MSIMIVAVDPRRVAIAVDSRIVFPDGARAEISKLLVIPHRNIALAARGNVNTLFFTYGEALSNRWAFDECVDLAPAVFQRRLQKTLDQGKRDGIPDAFLPFFGNQQNELVIAGFSDETRSMRAILATFSAEGLDVREIKSFLFAPGAISDSGADPNDEAAWRSMADDLTYDAAFHRAANYLIDGLRAAGNDAVCGGALLVAELSRRDCLIRNLGTIGNRGGASYGIA